MEKNMIIILNGHGKRPKIVIWSFFETQYRNKNNQGFFTSLAQQLYSDSERAFAFQTLSMHTISIQLNNNISN